MGSADCRGPITGSLGASVSSGGLGSSGGGAEETTRMGSENTYLDDALAGSKGQPHQAGAIDGHDLVPNAQLP